MEKWLVVTGVRNKEEKKRESVIMKAGSKRNLGGDGKLSILILVVSPWIYTYDKIALTDTYTHIHKRKPVKLAKSESEVQVIPTSISWLRCSANVM